MPEPRRFPPPWSVEETDAPSSSAMPADEQICAHVEPLAGASIDAMAVRSYLGQHLARYKVPKVVELSASLPREDSGKIFKRKLRAPYWEKAGRSI
jgi:long-chain acyl-CoA synthetase